MKCLVTGGAGFIGSHLSNKLFYLGHEVIVLDIVPLGERNNVADINLVGDISDYGYRLPDCDWCFHLAALADVVPSIMRPEDYHRTNVDGTLNVLNHCIKTGVKRFIYASSSWLYGVAKETPTPETAPIVTPNPYALTKYLAEQYVMNLGGIYKLPVVSLRLTAVYGPGMKSKEYGSVFKVFLAQKANNAPYTLVGDGSQSRDYIYVSDVVDAFIRAAEDEAACGEIFNVSTGNTVPIKRIIELLGDSNGITYLPERPGEPEVTRYSNRKIWVKLGWKPMVTFEQGMAIMREHIDEWKGEPVWVPETIAAATKEWYKYQA